MQRALKVSKVLVAQVQDSLRHWRAHARLERLRGRIDEARKVYRTVLSATSPGASSIGQLWWDWAEMEWLSGSPDAALQVILRSAGTNGSGNVVILRSKRELDDICSTIPEDRWKEREAWVNLRALLELLTSTLSATLTIIDASLARLRPSTDAHESMVVSSLSMLYVYGTVLRRPLAPSVLRQRAEDAIQLYPSNTLVLGIFLESEKGQGVWGRVKVMLGETDPTSEKELLQVLAEVWAVGWEKGSWKLEEERIRNRLSAAVQSDRWVSISICYPLCLIHFTRTRCSPILWRIYLEFEIRAGRLKQAKQLLFRAIRECPMVKGKQ